MLRDLIRLIQEMINQSKYEDTFRGLYYKVDKPKTFGTHIGGRYDTYKGKDN